jgi:hypothetical protein
VRAGSVRKYYTDWLLEPLFSKNISSLANSRPYKVLTCPGGPSTHTHVVSLGRHVI